MRRAGMNKAFSKLVYYFHTVSSRWGKETQNELSQTDFARLGTSHTGCQQHIFAREKHTIGSEKHITSSEKHTIGSEKHITGSEK